MELLNGKAKDLFLSFMCKKYRDFKWFEYASLLDVCQSAIIIEWLDSIGYRIGIDPYYDQSGTFRVFLGGYGFQSNDRQQATTEAIKKVVELINESNGK